MHALSAPEIIHATVQAGAIETPYRRAGHGPTLLLLCSADDGDAVDAPLFAALSASFRVIAPQPLMADDGPVWLRDVLDGLGLTRAILIADTRFAAAAHACARDDPDRIHRLILMDEDDPESVIPRLLDDYADLSSGARVTMNGSRHPVTKVKALAPVCGGE